MRACPLAQRSPSLESLICKSWHMNTDVTMRKAVVASFITAKTKTQKAKTHNCWSKEELNPLEFYFTLDSCYMTIRRNQPAYWQGRISNNTFTSLKNQTEGEQCGMFEVYVRSVFHTGAGLVTAHSFPVVEITPLACKGNQQQHKRPVCLRTLPFSNSENAFLTFSL